MSTTIIHPRRRAIWPALNLVLAGTALAVGLVAISSDDVVPPQKPVSVVAPKAPSSPDVCGRLPGSRC